MASIRAAEDPWLIGLSVWLLVWDIGFSLLYVSLVGENGLRREGKGICLKAGLPEAKSLESWGLSWFLFKVSRVVGRQGRG